MKNPRRRKSSSSWKLWIIPVFVLFVGGIMLGLNKDKVLNRLGLQTIDANKDASKVLVGQELDISGDLSSSDNLRLYTMILTTKEHKLFGLKPFSTDISSYRGKYATVKGTVIEIINGMPIINVSSISEGNNNAAKNTTTIYVSDAHLLIKNSKLKNYTFEGAKDGKLTFKQVENENNAIISYQKCDKDTCAAHTEKNTVNSTKFKGNNQDTWIQSTNTTSRHGTDGRMAYTSNNITKSDMQDIVFSLSMIDDAYVNQNYAIAAKRTCANPQYTLNSTEKTTVSYKSENAIELSLYGKDTNDADIVCLVAIDPSNDNISLSTIKTYDKKKEETDKKEDKKEKEEEKKKEDTKKEEDKADVNADINTDPKPILSTPHIFKSSKGYSITFPSNNISFEGINTEDKPSIDGVSGCTWGMNVVKFSSAEIIKEKPAIIMHHCSKVSSKIGDLGKYIRKTNNDGRNFFIEVINPEWKEFAQKIKIQ